MKIEIEYQEDCKKTKKADDLFFIMMKPLMNKKGDCRLLFIPIFLTLSVIYFVLTVMFRIEIEKYNQEEL